MYPPPAINHGQEIGRLQTKKVLSLLPLSLLPLSLLPLSGIFYSIIPVSGFFSNVVSYDGHTLYTSSSSNKSGANFTKVYLKLRDNNKERIKTKREGEICKR
jgi:hypothetical protein